MATFYSFTPTSLAAPFHSLRFLVRKSIEMQVCECSLQQEYISCGVLAYHLSPATAVKLHGQIYAYRRGTGTLCRRISKASHGPFTDMYFTTREHFCILAAFSHWGRNQPHHSACIANLLIPCIFELLVVDLTYVPLPLLLCQCTCIKRQHIANSMGGNLCLDATDGQYCAHNPMPTTFFASLVFWVSSILHS